MDKLEQLLKDEHSYEILWELEKHRNIPDYTTELISSLGVMRALRPYDCHNLFIKLPNCYSEVPSKTPAEIIQILEDITQNINISL